MSESAIARLIGEGVERPEASLPLDINYAKLAEWLVTRQKIPKDWHKRLQVIQAKAAEALKEVPADVLKKLADGADAPVDYLRAVEIKEQLASTSERTMFGGLSGPAATWDKIGKAYEKQYVFLGECAQTLVQNVDYDIPYLRRQAAKLNQQILDGDRRHAEYVRNAAACAAKYKEECKKLGIQGVAARQELRALASELPAMLRRVVDSLHDPRLQSAAEYYSAFTRFAHAPRGTRGAAAAAASVSAPAAEPSLEPEAMLPTLFEIRARRTQPPAPAADLGDGAATGSAADGAAEASTTAAAAAAPVEIDWDLGLGAGTGESAGAPVDVDWDVGGPAEAAGGDGGGINWDIDLGEAGGGVADTSGAAADGEGGAGGDASASAAAAPITIDWDIEVDDVGEGAQAAEAAGGDGADGSTAATTISEAAATATGVGAGAETGGRDPDDVAAARLERDGDYRGRLMDDLLELRAFLAQRKSDLSGSGSELLATALPDAVSCVDGATVGSMLAAVQGVLGELAAPRFRQLLLIATSQRYLDRLEASLQRQAGAEAKLLRAAADVRARQQEARAQLVGLAPRVGALVERTRRLKGLAEKSIAAALGGKRTINVLGEINNVLAGATQ